MSVVIRGTIRAGRVEVDGPIGLPDGTAVTITGGEDDGGPLPPEEVAARLAAIEADEGSAP